MPCGLGCVAIASYFIIRTYVESIYDNLLVEQVKVTEMVGDSYFLLISP